MKLRNIVPAVALALAGGTAQAVTFETNGWKGDFTNTLSTGIQYSVNDCEPNINSNLNGFNRCAYPDSGIPSWTVKGNHELLLEKGNYGDSWAFFGRVDWVSDLRMNDARETDLHPDAKDTVDFDPRLLDLFVEKSYTLGDQVGRVRVGRQVINWGESLFFFGGLNYATNPVDINRITLPGGQIKELLLPVEMVSVSQAVTDGLGIEAYYQWKWQGHQFPPSGTFWSTSDFIGDGNIVTDPTVLNGYEDEAKDSGQYGVALKYTPDSGFAEFGLYYARYHEKFPWFGWDSRENFGDYLGVGLDTPRLYHKWAEDIDMYGASVSTDVGEWAIGAEVSYRPNDVIATDPFGGCLVSGIEQVNGLSGSPMQNDCLRRQKRWGFDVTAVNLLQPNGVLGGVLDALGADTGLFMAEVGGFHFPNLDPVDTDVAVALNGRNKTSWGFATELSVTYEGSLIPGWGVTPGLFYRNGMSGSSQELLGWWRDGAQESNLYVNFADNDSELIIGVQWLAFWGTPKEIVDNRDKDVISITAQYAF